MLDYKLILIEGLPGTGKTTLSNRFFELMSNDGIDVELLLEEHVNIPSNFFNIAGIPKSEIKNLLFDKSQITSTILTESDNYIYINLGKCTKETLNQLRRYDIGDEHNKSISAQEYACCTLEWWQNWVKNYTNKSVLILDSAFMQCPINEMIFRGATDLKIKEYIKNIAEIIKPINPICIYLRRESVKEAINFARTVKGEYWTVRVKEGLERLGCPDLFERRYKLEMTLLPLVSNIVCDIKGSDWSDAEKKIETLLY